jgi:hypothetical protein
MLLSPSPKQQFFTNDGKPAVGYLLFTYANGTAVKIATYVDASGAVQNTNPIELDFRGECDLWIDPTLAYTYVLAPLTDTDPPTNPVWTVDDITAGGGGGGGSVSADATILTVADETAAYPNSRQLLPGTNITFDDSVAGERTVNASVGGTVFAAGTFAGDGSSIYTPRNISGVVHDSTGNYTVTLSGDFAAAASVCVSGTQEFQTPPTPPAVPLLISTFVSSLPNVQVAFFDYVTGLEVDPQQWCLQAISLTPL